MRSALVLLILMVLSLVAPAAENTAPNRDAAGNLVPTPKGLVCIAPAAEMRRNHMTMLLHQRDQTVQLGIRDQPASLVACINCHVTPDANGKVARSADPEFFCTSCHAAASVKIDCFECHADRPAEMSSRASSLIAAESTSAHAMLPVAIQARLAAIADAGPKP